MLYNVVATAVVDATFRILLLQIHCILFDVAVAADNTVVSFPVVVAAAVDVTVVAKAFTVVFLKFLLFWLLLRTR